MESYDSALTTITSQSRMHACMRKSAVSTRRRQVLWARALPAFNIESHLPSFSGTPHSPTQSMILFIQRYHSVQPRIYSLLANRHRRHALRAKGEPVDDKSR